VAEPFGRRAPAGARALKRLFVSRKAGAMGALEDLLGSAARVSDVSDECAQALTAVYGVDLGRRFAGARRHLYRRFLEYCLVDCALSAEESADLRHLRLLLRLGDPEVAQIHDEVALKIYGGALADVLADQRLDPEERAFLGRLGAELRLSAETADALYRQAAEQSRRRYVARAHVHDGALLASQTLQLDVRGDSDASLEGAIGRALEEASRAVPALRWAEVQQIRTEVRDGCVARWHVTLRAGVDERKPGS
jgi:flavin-binding protein dodecin